MSETPEDQSARPRPRPPAHRASPPDIGSDAPGGTDVTDNDDTDVTGPDGTVDDVGDDEVDDVGAEPDDDAAGGDEAGGGDEAAVAARQRRTRRRILLQGAALLVVVAVVAVVLVVRHSSSGGGGAGGSGAPVDQSVAALTNQAAANAFVAGASSDVAAVTSYDYRSLDAALYAGTSVATGEFLHSFRAALTGPLGAQARTLHRVQTFDEAVAGAGRMSSDGTTADVLVFGTQTVTDDSTRQKPRSTPVTLVVSVRREGDRYLISKLASGGNPGLPPGTRALDQAAEAGRETVAAVLTLRHDHVAADIAALLNGVVDPLRSKLSAQTAKTRGAIEKGRYDLTGTVTSLAVEQASDTTVVLLIAATGLRTDPGQKPRVVTDGRYEATVVRVGSRWLTTSLDAVRVG